MTLPSFELPDAVGGRWSSSAADDKPTLVLFLCNHCPHVKHIADVLGQNAKSWSDQGVVVVGINSNDWNEYPSDHPDRMPAFAEAHGWTFPYLVDEFQLVAREFGAVCTPDIFLFDRAHRLAYRGQFDGTRPGSGREPTGGDLARAVTSVLADQAIDPESVFPPVGCSIKWRD